MEVAAKGKAKRRHLNATECVELAQSSNGPDALTRPHVVDSVRGKRNPDRGLYPRTPTKRPRPGTSSASPSSQQKGIGDFFSVAGVIRSSPTKSSRSCSAAQPSTVDVNSSLEQRQAFMEEDDDDDVSLLAAVDENDDIDDASLLAAVEDDDDDDDDVSLLATESAAKQEMEVDHLEGMTPEMFGADDVFDDEDDDVEALPDSHYGLLGRREELLQPQGRMDDLPEEILRQILCEIPARDLYCNVSLVCQRWRSLIQDPKFLPFKKQYYRYVMQEETTVAEIGRVLTDSHILHPMTSQHSVRNLITLMAQYVPGERVRPEDVLQRVAKHRLFPHAEASIRLHIPHIQNNFSLGLQGPNPYAAMAVILVLNESVSDVQALVSLLSGCMSSTAIKEYLSRMATLLLALMRNEIRITNRLHYNIYYVLHLMENGPFCVNPGLSGGQPQIHLTMEQLQILSHNMQLQDVIKIVAFAGTGKTTTLVKYAEQRPHLRFLYVAFNKSVANEAQRRFPSNVISKTVHSLAFADIGRSYHIRKKLTFGLKPFSVSKALPEGRGGFAKAKIVTTTLNAFMASADPEICDRHVPRYRVVSKEVKPVTANPHCLHHPLMDVKEYIDPKEIPLFVRDAKDIWNKMKDLHDKEKDAHFMTHDGYLKLWQLQDPKPQLSDQFNAIMIDEAQDCNPVIMDVMLSQLCSKILVGDPHQQIYTFRGAVNALKQVEHTHIYYLTQSFRFGAEIAYVGATILTVCKGVNKLLVGGKQKGGVCDQAADDVHAAVHRGASPSPGDTAILARSNVTVFSEAVQLTIRNPKTRIHFVGGVEGIGLDRILDVWTLYMGAKQNRYIKDPLLRAFAKGDCPFDTLRSYAELTQDNELMSKVEIVNKYKCHIPDMVARLKECAESNRSRADFIIGTVHKAKGLEFNTVMVCDDFVKLPPAGEPLCYYYRPQFNKIPEDELNLLYVAVTRAKTTLIITKNIRRILTLAGEYFLKSELPASFTAAAVGAEAAAKPPACTTSRCPNRVALDSAFVMCRRRMKCTDGVTKEGPLCSRCAWSCVGPTAFLTSDKPLSLPAIPLPPELRVWPVYHHIFLDIFQYLHSRN